MLIVSMIPIQSIFAATYYWGKTSIGGTGYSVTTNVDSPYAGIWFTAEYDGEVISSSAYVETQYTVNMKMAIYTWKVGQGSCTLLGSSDERQVSIMAPGWINFTWTTPLALEASENYTLFIWSSNTFSLFYDTVTDAARGSQVNYVYNGWETSLWVLVGTRYYSMYVTVFDSIMSVSADLEDVDDDGADWVFTDWKYYDFTATVEAYAENVSLQMSIETSFETVTLGVFANSSYQSYVSNMSYSTREGEPVRLGSTSYAFNASGNDYTVVVFPLWFEANCLDLWDAADGVDVWGSYNSSAYELVESDFFRIYSKGGFTLNYESSNDTFAYLIDGGNPFSFHVEDDGGSAEQWVYNEIWWRDVQHLKLLPDIHFLAGYEDFFVKYGVDYSLGDGVWEDGWQVIINPDFVSYTGLFAANVWINMTIVMGDRLDLGRVYDDLYMFYHGSVSAPGDAGHFSIWVDLWFSDKNASSVGAARVNAYEFPMIDNADLWLRWLANNWGVKDDVPKELSYDYSLMDADDGTQMSSEKVKMVRYWSNVSIDSAGGGQIVEITNFEAFDATHSAQLPLTGVSSPVFDETITPTVGAKGILGALWSMFAGLGSWLSENVIFGGLNLWGTFVDFLDTIAGWLGAPKFFTNLFTWVGEAVGYLGTSFDYLINIMSDVFSLFGSLLGVFLTTMGDLIASIVNTVTIFTDMMGGAYGAGVDVWETLGISSWLTVALVFYPLYLIILWDTEGMDAVIKQLTLIFGLLSWVFTFMSGVIMEGITLISTLIESIPVAE